MSPRNGSTSLGDGLRRIMSRLDREGHMTTAAVIDVWDRIVGDDIATHTTIEGLRGSELLVAVDSPIWANELQAMAGHLVARLQEELGQTPIRSIRFTVTRAVSARRSQERAEQEAEQRYGGPTVTPEPLSEEELEAVKRSVANIENESLRDAALRATVRDLEWKKGQERQNSSEKPSGGF